MIVGGVAVGASCAARLRRLDEKVEILMMEGGPYFSHANCGLPYRVGGVIPKESSLVVEPERMFRGVFGIEVRTGCEAIAIAPKRKTVGLRDVATDTVKAESQDKLVLSPGAPWVRPPLPGIFRVRTVPDARTIREWIERGTTFLAGMFNDSGIQFVTPPRHAVVIGGGCIGLEMAENLVHLGFYVTLVEMLAQVLAPLDRELARLVQEHLKRNGVHRHRPAHHHVHSMDRREVPESPVGSHRSEERLLPAAIGLSGGFHRVTDRGVAQRRS